MIRANIHSPDSDLDLTFTRIVDVPAHLIWRAWTEPELIKKWFTPAPWKTVDCEIDLRPGGIFRTMMRSPEGQDFPNLGCFLDVIENEWLVWTAALGPGFRPAPENKMGFPFTAVIALAPHGAGTKYSATVFHADKEGRDRHAAMGFAEGWGKALDQLVALMKNV